ncbi:MAG: hypothetical protein COW73_01210 [Nitrospirae bacterium CG18_big_fil_WC_8_21_14_2_50_70_55]|nr:hypothetical protein [Deltaproteobacteria bacterium]OIP64963.1 MAG: hypothetical protein AUK30_05665 [Nitrospirae bacterium CG2_30_70_394]PIQ07029.1 MAG: hypothetical protein COW73_01210 [Nitrospirae bacterium CG18_big_fil_WC_8_21_14_2_50_70_55]PIU79888.1 MAG: hypothetical protein COS73_02090 [Nitrospirae bacterium CG06_land_8_20_14_3_00_70_43]PIW82813.1 MAG: hypothetical protein COZ96_06805 [Nitrospirae bacterium CG_4_8_14_3_um_filter_70_85]PIX84224.1 MAG: hypothetical protein COZ33_01415 
MPITSPSAEEQPKESRITRALEVADHGVHVLAAVVLFAAALLMIGHSVAGFRDTSAHGLLTAINDILFVLIIMEVVATIVRHLQRRRFSLYPFLYIVIISSIRRILVVEAQLSMEAGLQESQAFTHALWEMAAAGGLIVAMVVAYWLLRHADHPGD